MSVCRRIIQTISWPHSPAQEVIDAETWPESNARDVFALSGNFLYHFVSEAVHRNQVQKVLIAQGLQVWPVEIRLFGTLIFFNARALDSVYAYMSEWCG